VVIEQSIKQGIYEIRTVCDSTGQRVELVSGRDTEAYPQDTGIGLLLAALLRHGVPALEGTVEAGAFRLLGADLQGETIDKLEDQLDTLEKENQDLYSDKNALLDKIEGLEAKIESYERKKSP
jgi:fructose-1,6-bisphosphatase/sedoheptulose 1,7-bisphosphatase-like protein